MPQATTAEPLTIRALQATKLSFLSRSLPLPPYIIRISVSAPPASHWFQHSAECSHSSLCVLTTTPSFTFIMSFPDFVFNTNPIQDIFLFPVITLNNSLCHTTPQHSAVSIHQMDWADTLGIIAPYPNPFSSHPMEVFWPSGNCLECPSIQLPFANEPNPNGSPHRH